ncbi:unnamed protein product [Ixodes hexagonus]
MLCSARNAVKRHSARIAPQSLSLWRKLTRFDWLFAARTYSWYFREAMCSLMSALPPCEMFTSHVHSTQNPNFSPFLEATKHGNSAVYAFRYTWKYLFRCLQFAIAPRSHRD